MQEYPKTILSIEGQLQSYKQAGLIIQDEEVVREALSTIGYYRLRGYHYHLYDNKSKRFKSGTTFEQILGIYQFNTELSELIFMMATEIEVALRARLIEVLLIHGDALILMDPTIFSDKKCYWENLGKISNEIRRSKDLFIKHQFKQHGGQVPIWAALEVMSFGTLSKMIENLYTQDQKNLAANYPFITKNGHQSNSYKLICSWIHAVSVLRNICAHRGRIYNRDFAIQPTLPKVDAISPNNKRVYPILLAMKWLRPSDTSWIKFETSLNKVIDKYSPYIDLQLLGFPSDWKEHMKI